MFHLFAFIIAAEAAAPAPTPESGMSKGIMNIIFAAAGAVVMWLWGGKKPAPAPAPAPTPDPNHPDPVPVPSPSPAPANRPVADMVAQLITIALDAARGLNPVRDQAIMIALGHLKQVLDQLGIQPIQSPFQIQSLSIQSLPPQQPKS